MSAAGAVAPVVHRQHGEAPLPQPGDDVEPQGQVAAVAVEEHHLRSRRRVLQPPRVQRHAVVGRDAEIAERDAELRRRLLHAGQRIKRQPRLQPEDE
jgi:hypothetical protein